jgi:hypothetical protein
LAIVGAAGAEFVLLFSLLPEDTSSWLPPGLLVRRATEPEREKRLVHKSGEIEEEDRVKANVDHTKLLILKTNTCASSYSLTSGSLQSLRSSKRHYRASLGPQRAFVQTRLYFHKKRKLTNLI